MPPCCWVSYRVMSGTDFADWVALYTPGNNLKKRRRGYTARTSNYVATTTRKHRADAVTYVAAGHKIKHTAHAGAMIEAATAASRLARTLAGRQ